MSSWTSARHGAAMDQRAREEKTSYFERALASGVLTVRWQCPLCRMEHSAAEHEELRLIAEEYRRQAAARENAA